MIDGQWRDEIEQLEKRRCAALVAGDTAALAEIVDDDLVHVHGSGHLDGKADYLKGVETKYKFHGIERGELNMRRFGDVIVVVGPLRQTVSVNGIDKLNNISAVVTQTWVRRAAGWRQTTCHMGFLSVA